MFKIRKQVFRLRDEFNTMVDFIGISSLILDYIGAVIILYGGAIAVVRTLQLEPIVSNQSMSPLSSCCLSIFI